MTHHLSCKELFAQNKVIPVVMLNDINTAVTIAHALLQGGISIIEVTLRTPNALAIIHTLSKEVPEMIVGAGTILNDEQYHSAVAYGAKFIVSPGLTDELAKVSAAYPIPFLPGAITPTEIMQALLHGFEYLKFFPAESYNGYNTLKALSAPFAQAKFCPTGGINLDNMHKYLSLHNVVGVGCGYLVNEDLVKQGNFSQITNLANQAVEISNE
ncbi:MAG: bifunctional 4-hydroxy-2-oxoglutarate aldolase/2-dehydro-3-deoxy-phosphogluconate aldolase [Burkholderiales bacterium]|nr:bifunctional 4-hydroxy-2-oxoglutarate aldolase/2-dehydro-3-deoxy-phosphogluconate aldolase [Burkholderiales bacterium]